MPSTRKASELSHRLYYHQPAATWEESLPIGSGRLGAMIGGKVDCDSIPLNEDTLWSGFPRNTNRLVDPSVLEECRTLVAEHRFTEAGDLIDREMLGDFTESYMPAGNLLLEFPSLTGSVSDYVRDLDLNTATASVRFTDDGVHYLREYFASCPDNGLIMHFSADRPGKINLKLSYTSPLPFETDYYHRRMKATFRCPAHVEPSYIHDAENPIIQEMPDGRSGMRGCVIVKPLVKGGSMTHVADGLLIENADQVTLLTAIRSGFCGPDQEPDSKDKIEEIRAEKDIQNLCSFEPEELYRRHLSEYSAYYSRAKFSLSAESEDIPTDVRLQRFAEHQEDPVLYSLLFHYGRYLLISSSRPGSQAANLQGIWSHLIRPVWSSNYTINIITQMNYWPAEICALPEMAEPLFDLISLLQRHGAITAREQYHSRGSVAHHNSDIWGLTNPVGRGRKGFYFAYWNASLGWLSRHLWDHYLYSDDPAFLAEQALPVLEACSLFFLDNLLPNAAGNYILTPAASPENVFLYHGEKAKIAREATMSQAIVREVFSHYLEALTILTAADALPALSASEEDISRIQTILPLLQGERIGSQGQLLEWDEEYEEADPHHRHVSHLYGLYPAHQISPDRTKSLFEACKTSLRLRGDEGTGWSLAWKINLWARLRDGAHVLHLLNRQLRVVPAGDQVKLTGGGSYPNLLDAHPPFQIDGNFGTCAGIAECLLQADGREILLLPALPPASCFAAGSMLGLRAPHGLTVDLYWSNHQLHHAVFHVDHPLAEPTQIRDLTIRETTRNISGFSIASSKPAPPSSISASFDRKGTYVYLKGKLLFRG
ncbi:MAG: glycoside hydrolase family 95 protein [Firmicutes bacterium]|nr:glycoside hydrolase family 95 protein [Bacillota bacterium]